MIPARLRIVVSLGLSRLLPALLAVGTAARAEVFATGDGRILVFGDGATGDTEPYHVIEGVATLLSEPASLAVDLPHRELFVSESDGRILVFDLDDDGDAAPKREIAGAATGLVGPRGMAIDPLAGELWVADAGANRIVVFARDADGDVAPLRTVSGGTSKISTPIHLFLDLAHGELYASNLDFSATPEAAPAGASEPSVTVHSLAALAGPGNHDVAPVRRLAGGATGLSSPRGIVVELANDAVVVADYAGDLGFWSRTADGDVAPAKSIFGAPSHLHQAYDLVLRPDGELLVGADGSPDSAVVGHALGATGEASPVRLLTGPSTLLEYSTGVASDRARYCSQGNSTDGCLFRDNFENGQICYWSDSQGGPGCS